MWILPVTVAVLTTIVGAELPDGPPGIHREVSDGVKSMGFKLVYGDEDMAIMNEVITDVEKKSALKKSINLNEAIDPLPAQDVKCLMSVDRYCSKEMGEIKSILINAVKEDCVKCTVKEREMAGKVIAAMLAHDPVAWKLFLTRSILQTKKRKELPKVEQFEFKDVGEPEDVIRSPRNRYAMPGVQVRVKRYQSELVPLPPSNSTQ